MSTESPIPLLLIDPQEIVREALSAMLGLDRRFVVVGHAGSGSEGVTLALQALASVIVLELRLPGEDGFAILADLRRRAAASAVLILTTNAHAHDIAQCKDLGAAGYLTKSATREQLISALTRLNRGLQCWEWAVGRSVPTSHRLTRRELEVLECLRLGRSNDDIGRAIGISEHTVKSHVKTLFSKLEVANRGEAVARGFELGILNS